MLEKGNYDTNIVLYYLKVLNISILELVILLLLQENPKPSHLKYQIKTLIENNDIKIREILDILLNNIHIERSNISSISRSENAMNFFVDNFNNKNAPYVKLALDKLRYFKNKSQYVDAYLLVHCFIKNQNLDNIYVKNYSKFLNYALDTQIKENVSLTKESETLFDINKYFIKNIY
jgi:hypothetical protein